jgi:UDP-2,4-diacetamido-2,4,6-trideoxy-beta-L-altropyranose hydrolase
MAEHMCQADLSIGAAGSTAWERCCLGLPSVLVILADNQVLGTRAMEARGLAIAVGSTSEELQAMLPAAMASLSAPGMLHRMSHAAAKVTSGDGAVKVADSLLEVAGGVHG